MVRSPDSRRWIVYNIGNMDLCDHVQTGNRSLGEVQDGATEQLVISGTTPCVQTTLMKSSESSFVSSDRKGKVSSKIDRGEGKQDSID
jgi:hypothetical protein